MIVKRTKELDRILEQIGVYFNPVKAQKVEDYIKLLEEENEHLRRCIAEWQKQSDKKHPTIGF